MPLKVIAYFGSARIRHLRGATLHLTILYSFKSDNLSIQNGIPAT